MGWCKNEELNRDFARADREEIENRIMEQEQDETEMDISRMVEFHKKQFEVIGFKSSK